MNIKYLFDQEITEENKLALKTLTSSISENCNIGIYFTTKTEDLTLDNNYQHEILSNCKSIFYISTNEILEVTELSSIISFLISQEIDDACNFEYYVFATRENSDVIKLAVLKYVHYEFDVTKFNKACSDNGTTNQGYKMYNFYTKETCDTKEKLLKLSVSYFMDIVTSRLKTFNVQIKSGNYDEKITHSNFEPNSSAKTHSYYSNKEYKADLKQMKIFESNKEHHNLIDLYHTYCNGLTDYKTNNIKTLINTNNSTSTTIFKIFNKVCKCWY